MFIRLEADLLPTPVVDLFEIFIHPTEGGLIWKIFRFIRIVWRIVVFKATCVLSSTYLSELPLTYEQSEEEFY